MSPNVSTGTGGGNSKESGFTAEMCLAAFEEEITISTSLLAEGLIVTLDEVENALWIALSGSKIKILGTRRSAMVRNCKAIGIYYTGKIHVNDSKKMYARFIRTV